ncbi:MAG: polysaccharide deacetylase family protein [candidate division Zixibacteria bacterium]|nr:polysaccharide deacetylase family protein [candidate division Zixibacteria bacterium]
MVKFSEKQIIFAGKAFRYLGFSRLARFQQPTDNIRISTTHFVKSSDMENFDKIIRFISTKREIITPDKFFEIYGNNNSNKLKGEKLLMTFDDGFYSSYRAAKKVLSKYNIKAIFFIPTKILDLRTKEEMKKFSVNNIYNNEVIPKLLTEEEYVFMNRDNLIDLHNDGHWILPHSHTHCDISKIKNEEDVYRELIQPQEILSKLLGDKIESFAFPNGTEKVVSSFSYNRMMEIYKFTFPALLGINHTGTDPHFFHRDCIHAHYSLNYVNDILNGVFDPYYSLKMKRLQNKIKCT